MVAARIAAITAATALPLIGWAGVAAASGMTSTQGVYKKGVYADNKLLVVKGEWHEKMAPKVAARWFYVSAASAADAFRPPPVSSLRR